MRNSIAAALVFSLSLLVSAAALADGTIDQLSAGSVLGGTESIPMFQGSNPAVKTTPNAIQTFLDAQPHTFTGIITFGEVKGTTETVTLDVSNNYTALSTDCGKIKLLPTGTTPTVTLPNINQSCTISFITTAAISYLFNVASGGTKQNTNNFYNTRGLHAGDTVSVTITVPSSSAATWSITGDVTS